MFKYKLVCLLILVKGFVYSQTIEKAIVKSYSIEDGLSQSSVYAISEDMSGFVWLGTLDGLNKYDGYNFKVYRHNPIDPNSLADNIVFSLFLHSDGDLWIGTYSGGVCRYNYALDNFQCYSSGVETGLSNNTIRDIVEDTDGVLWFATDNGVNKYNPEENNFSRIELITTGEQVNDYTKCSIRALSIDDQGNLVVALESKLLVYDINKGKAEEFIISSDDEIVINKIVNNHLRYIAIATNKGLFKFIDEKIVEIPFGIEADIQGLKVVDNKLWVATRTKGVFLFNHLSNRVETNDFFNANSMKITQDKLHCLYQDRNENIWIGTDGSGVKKITYEKQFFKHFMPVYNNTNSLNDRLVWHVVKDTAGFLWIGTGTGGLNKFDIATGRYEHFNSRKQGRNYLPCDDIRCIYDKGEKMLIGTGNCGVIVFHKEKGITDHFYKGKKGCKLSCDIIRFIEKGPKGNLWIGTDDGLNIFNDLTNEFEQPFNDSLKGTSLASNKIWSFLADKDSNIWLGSCGEGINKIDSKTGKISHFRYEKGKTGISNNLIRSIKQTPDGNIWIATSRGLNKYSAQDDSFEVYTVNEGLPNDLIYCILVDNGGMLWLSTNSGVSRFDPEKEEFLNFNIGDGLQSNEFNQGAGSEGVGGELFFGGINGFNSFYPEDILTLPSKEKVILTDFLLFNKPVPLTNESVLNQHITYSDQVVLGYDDNVFTIEFSAMNFKDPQKNKYEIKLKGFNENWIALGSKNFATFTNLNPDNYVFQVRTVNKAGEPNTDIASVKVKVQPPFWKTKAFYFFIFLIIASLIFVVFKIRTRRLIKLKNLLERTVRERTKEIIEQKEEIKMQVSKLEEANKELERLSIVARETDNGVIIANEKGEIEWVNEGFRRMYGYTLQEFKTKIGKTLFEGSGNPDIIKIISDCIRGKETVTYFAENNNKNGEVIFSHTTITPIIDKSGKLKKLIVIDSDYTKIRDAQRQVEQAHQKVAEDKAKSEFLTNLSHEIRTPLNAIIGFTRLLEKESLSENGNQHVRTILSNSDILLQLIQDLIDLSKTEFEDQNLIEKEVDIAILISRLLRIFETKVNEKGLQIKVNIEKSNMPVFIIDELRLRQVLLNLIGNAIKFTSKGFVMVSVDFDEISDEKLNLKIEIEDTGIGITEKDKQIIFKAFHQIDSKTIRKFGGIGIGLSIASKLVQSMGGSIELLNKEEKGSVFRILIPNVRFVKGVGVNMDECKGNVRYKSLTEMFVDEVKSEKLSDFAIANLESTISILEADYLMELEHLIAVPKINQIKEFASGIKTIGKLNDIEVLKSYGEMLFNSATKFNINKIKKLLKVFPTIIDELKEL